MATAASASLHPLLRHAAVVPKQLTHFTSSNLSRTKSLLLQRLLLSHRPTLPRHLLHPFSSSSSAVAAAAHADEYEEEDFGEEFIEEDEELVGEEQLLSPTGSSPSPSTGDAGRLYVGNLPYAMNSSQLAEIFSEAGAVDSVEVVYDRVTDRSRGFAFVTMATAADAEAAIRMLDASQIGGRTVKVNFPEVPRGGEREVMGPKARSGSRGYLESPHKVYAGNLGWAVTSQSLKDAFGAQTGLLGAKVIYDRDSGRSRGFGFVTFASAEEAQAAMEAMDGVEVEGRPLRLSPASARPPPLDRAAGMEKLTVA